jgi:hypothetical protein
MFAFVMGEVIDVNEKSEIEKSEMSNIERIWCEKNLSLSIKTNQ